MVERSSLGRRVSQAFILQLLLISATAVSGVFAARWVLQDVLIRQALEDEAAYFWERRAVDARTLMPDTRNLKVYLVPGVEEPPDWLVRLEPGFQRVDFAEDGFSAAHVSRNAESSLYLHFKGERVGALAVYFGLLPLAAVLVALYIAAWFAYRRSRDAISPVVRLAQEVERMDPRNVEEFRFDESALPADAGFEVRALATALEHYSQRIRDLIDRERHFTRDASHELRTPISVIKMASRALERGDVDTLHRRNLDRIARAASEMEELTETFLLLARENDTGSTQQTCSVNAAADREAERARELIGDKPVTVSVRHEAVSTAACSSKILAVLIGNLVRNALQHTSRGNVVMRVGHGQLSVEDTGCGIDPQTLDRLFEPYYRPKDAHEGGFGIGLSIVRRLCNRFGWQVKMESAPGEGTRAMVRFEPS